MSFGRHYQNSQWSRKTEQWARYRQNEIQWKQCKELHLRERNQKYKCRVKSICLGSSVAEKILNYHGSQIVSQWSAVVAEEHVCSAMYSSFFNKTWGGDVFLSYSTGFGFCSSTSSHFMALAVGVVGKLHWIQSRATKRTKCLENSAKEGRLEKNLSSE